MMHSMGHVHPQTTPQGAPSHHPMLHAHHPHLNHYHQTSHMHALPPSGQQQQQHMYHGQPPLAQPAVPQPGQQHLHHPQPSPLTQQPPSQPSPMAQKLLQQTEQTWMSLGNLAESLNEMDRALLCYEHALKHNPYSVSALSQVAALYRAREQYPAAVDYFQRILNIEGNNGEIWGALGHCYLMLDDLPKAYNSYQQALYHMQNPKEPKLWYGIGILFDRYGSFDHAEEAFSSVLKMDPKFEKASEIYFRLGIIYKQQGKYDTSLQCFRYILPNPPKPLSETDIWFQIGHVYEMQKDFQSAKEAYEKVLAENANHAKVLQQLGWLYHQQNEFTNQETAISFLSKSLDMDANDPQTWYLLGRCYMAQQKFSKAYESYQQAVYRDGKNPIFWCSIGVLYYQINQFRDALDAYTRAIRLNPFISEVWFDLGTLYESCNNQVQDALDAYARAAELDPNNQHIQQRLQYLKQQQSGNGQTPAQPLPPPMAQDINPNQYNRPTQFRPQAPPALHPPGYNPNAPKVPVVPPSPNNARFSKSPSDLPQMASQTKLPSPPAQPLTAAPGKRSATSPVTSQPEMMEQDLHKKQKLEKDLRAKSTSPTGTLQHPVPQQSKSTPASGKVSPVLSQTSQPKREGLRPKSVQKSFKFDDEEDEEYGDSEEEEMEATDSN